MCIGVHLRAAAWHFSQACVKVGVVPLGPLHAGDIVVMGPGFPHNT